MKVVSTGRSMISKELILNSSPQDAPKRPNDGQTVAARRVAPNTETTREFISDKAARETQRDGATAEPRLFPKPRCC